MELLKLILLMMAICLGAVIFAIGMFSAPWYVLLLVLVSGLVGIQFSMPKSRSLDY